MNDELEFLIRYDDIFKRFQTRNDNISTMEFIGLAFCDKGVEVNGHRYAALYKMHRKSGRTHISAIYDENGLAGRLVEVESVPEISKIIKLFNRVEVCGLRVYLYDYRGRKVPQTKGQYYLYRFFQLIGW